VVLDPRSARRRRRPALLTELRRLARGNGWNVVRWITADDNHRAMATYDRYAERTRWVTYDMSAE